MNPARIKVMASGLLRSTCSVCGEGINRWEDTYSWEHDYEDWWTHDNLDGDMDHTPDRFYKIHEVPW